MNRDAICIQHKWQVTFQFSLFVNIRSHKLEKEPMAEHNISVPKPFASGDEWFKG